ncbi:MAG TPA: nitroreductase family protein [Gemmatimonadales bacterium]|nr:nitroreductase family protein [Gemmatimonadales bacterium]
MREPPPGAVFEPLTSYREYPVEEMEARSRDFAADLARRRTVRQFSDRPVPRSVIEACLEAAGTAPSGAHLQPWHFVVVSDPGLKRRIREAAETAEREFYARAPQEWLDVLAPLGTDAHKPYLETAPYLIAVFAQRYGLTPEGARRTHYYVMESVGIAAGLLLAALHHAGLASLTHTPNPMGFLGDVLERPPNERAVMLVVTGYPAPEAVVPRLRRKLLEAIATFR